MDCRDLHDKVGDLNLRAESCVTRKQQLLRRGWPARPSPRPARPPRAPRSGAPRAHRRASATSPASRWPQSSPRARRGRRGGRPAARSRIRTVARRSLQHALANRVRRPATMQPSSLPHRQPRAAWRRYRVSAGVANTPKRVVLKVSTTDKAASPLAKNAHKLDAWPPLTLPSSTSPAFVDKSSTLPAAEKYGACNHSPMITASSGIKPKQHKAFKARAPGDCTALPRSWGFNDRPIANINKPSPRWKAAGVPSAAHVTGKRTPKPAATKVQRGKNLVKLANHFASPEPPAPAAAARPASASLPRKGDERIRDRAYAQPGRRLSPRSHRCPAPPARKLPPATKCTRLCSRIAGPSAMRPPAKALVRISAIEVDR
mmetsp:Transcript_55466/g.179893  ORF Transcript_55466/g.179893 Transcript_55466/m.179893 type:complete len:374 (-) Transcript_55466:33-1154(-)